MALYAESSAVLSVLLGEEPGPTVGRLLTAAEHVVYSELTLAECRRTLCAAAAIGRLDPSATAAREVDLLALTARWDVITLGREVLDRAGQPFPDEPVRTLDAIHIASALVVRPFLPDLAVVSLDDRVRRVALSLGLPVLPEPPVQGALS
jgi:predicted nucleic acid-binding protein